MFLIWFRRVRDNAGELRPDGQRRAHGWSVGGWFCPVVNLWFPYQIAVDAVRSAPGIGSAGTGLLLVRSWWGALVMGGIVGRFLALHQVHTSGQAHVQVVGSFVSDALDLSAAVLAILLVRQLTTLLDRGRFDDIGRLRAVAV